LDEFLIVRLATAGAAARRELERECRARGRSFREALILAAANEQPLRFSVLADRLGLQRSEVSRVVYELCDEGFLEVRPDSFDGRAQVVHPCGGERIPTAIDGAFAAIDRRVRRQLTPVRQRQLAACLELLKGHRSPVADALTDF
jgi:DNA-binding MarR family transcriptional regulator